jgi:hypothetical protein
MSGFALQMSTAPDLTDPRVVYALHEIGERPATPGSSDSASEDVEDRHLSTGDEARVHTGRLECRGRSLTKGLSLAHTLSILLRQ